MIYHADFNTFFKLNCKDVQKYVAVTSWKYAHIMDPEDLAQDIIVKLMNSSFLTDWDKRKSALRTFFTGRVRGYALHIITAKIRELYRIIKENTPEGITKRYIPLFDRLDKERDFCDYSTDKVETSGYYLEVVQEPREEENLFLKEIITLFKKKTNALQRKIYDFHYWRGFTLKEIQVIMSEDDNKVYHYSFVRNRCAQATEIMLKILSSEGVKSAKQ